MYPMFPDVTHDWATPVGQLVKRGWKRLWAWWLATYVRFPLLRPVRYIYYVSYSYGPGSTSEYRSGSGNGSAEIIVNNLPLRSMEGVNSVRDVIVEIGPWSQFAPPSVVITSWKLLRKQVFRQKTWHDTRRQPRPA